MSILLFLIAVSCKDHQQKKETGEKQITVQEIIHEGYEVYKPLGEIKAVLVLFGGYPESPADIKLQFDILPIAAKNHVAMVLMNYNQKLYLEEEEKLEVANSILAIVNETQLPTDNMYFGGFSSGGNVSLLLSSFLVSRPDLGILPKGVFIVDSPIDLSQLYFASEKNIARDFSQLSVDESTWIINTLGKKFGNPHHDITAYEAYAVYTYKTDYSKNVEFLKNAKLRFYTEPDTIWWKENRMADYDQTNAYYIKAFTKTLQENGFTKVEYIPTKNRGYRANGDRHPHSWSIVDKEDLMQWILSE